MKGQEHCWHKEGEPHKTQKRLEQLVPIVCCQCGQRTVQRQEKLMEAIPLKHGRYYPREEYWFDVPVEFEAPCLRLIT